MELNIKLVRLVSNEELVCNLLEQTDDYIRFEHAISPVPGAGGNIGFMPFSPLQKKGLDIIIDMSNVMFITEPADEIVTQMHQIVNPSAVVTPPSKKLIL